MSDLSLRLGVLLTLSKIIADVITGKIGKFRGLLNVLANLSATISAFKDFDAILPEIKALSDADRAALVAQVKANLDLDNAQLTEIVEKVLEAVIHLSALIKVEARANLAKKL